MNYDRIILELLERVSVLEEKVGNLKKSENEERIASNVTFENTDLSNQYKHNGGKDNTKFILDGKRYGKNRLVLAVVKKYITMHPDTTAQELLNVFDKSLQGTFGVVQIFNDVKNNYSDYKKRFFTADDDIVKTKTQPCAVCTQWGITNIKNILARAEELGIKIKVVK